LVLTVGTLFFIFYSSDVLFEFYLEYPLSDMEPPYGLVCTSQPPTDNTDPFLLTPSPLLFLSIVDLLLPHPVKLSAARTARSPFPAFSGLLRTYPGIVLSGSIMGAVSSAKG